MSKASTEILKNGYKKLLPYLKQDVTHVVKLAVTFIVYVALFAAIAIPATFIFQAINVHITSVEHIDSVARSSASHLGQIGDFIGGMLNPIFGFMTTIALLITLRLQHKEAKFNENEKKNTTIDRLIWSKKKEFDEAIQEKSLHQPDGTSYSIYEATNVENGYYRQEHYPEFQALLDDAIEKWPPVFIEPFTRKSYNSLHLQHVKKIHDRIIYLYEKKIESENFDFSIEAATEDIREFISTNFKYRLMNEFEREEFYNKYIHE